MNKGLAKKLAYYCDYIMDLSQSKFLLGPSDTET